MKLSIGMWILTIFTIFTLVYVTSFIDKKIKEYLEVQDEEQYYYFTISDSFMSVFDKDDNLIGTISSPTDVDSLLIDYYE